MKSWCSPASWKTFTALCPRAKLSSQVLLEAISKTQICADMYTHSPNACRRVFGEGPLYWLFFLEYLFMCRLHEEKRTYYRSEVLYTACSPLWSFISGKAAGSKNKISCVCVWFLLEKSFTPFPARMPSQTLMKEIFLGQKMYSNFWSR